ncbi:MAG: DNA polymerase IV, partial [Jatrophihabitans sp.]
AATPLDTVRRAVGTATANHLHQLAHGQDDRVVHEREVEKSISTDRTMAADLLTEAAVARELLRGSGEVAERLRQAGRTARTVGIKIRFADFTTVTRVRTLVEPTDAAAIVYREALQLYRALNLDQPRIRLVGVKVENLRPASEPTQLAFDLTGAATRPAVAVDHAIDALTARFGEAAVRPASLLAPSAVSSAGGINRAKPRMTDPSTPDVITNRRDPGRNHGA